MGTAKAMSLRVRPLQATHLCFEVDGILGQSNAQLGATANEFDFPTFYAILGSIPTVAGDPSRLLYDFLEIQAAANPFTLAALRAEPRKAALNKAINARQNAFFAKYANAPSIISQINQYYSPSIIGSKPQRLAVLAGIADNQWNQLKSAYIADSRDGIVKTTGSTLSSRTESGGSTTTTGRTDEEAFGITTTNTGTFPAPPADAGWTSVTVTGSDPFSRSEQLSSSDDTATSSGYASQYQTIVNTDYGYRVPYCEGAAQYERAQISLIDQQFSQFMYAQSLPHLAQVFTNELQSIDGDVFRLQVAYLNTILMSPIAGIVTGIYKQAGDAVKAGEPVVRVENYDTILLVANVVYRGSIALGSTMKVTTSLFDDSGSPTSVTGNVVAARGRDDDDRWEVIAQCNNLNGGKHIFPLGYHFDYDDTTVSIT
jgi:hypothetical protein